MTSENVLAAKQPTYVKVPKGTRDWAGEELRLRDKILVLERHGGTPLDTPAFELRSILTDKYGEDSRLIYDLDTPGGEACSLRYDLTVPFARYLAMRPDISNMKRYQVAKVYRRDQPAAARGRMREFWQCDFDIAGVFDPMLPDAEIIRVIAEVFEALKMDVTVRLNNRKILDGLFEVAGVPAERIRAISSAVDKLDKASWSEVRAEMLGKGLGEDVADRVGKYVRQSGTMSEMLTLLSQEDELTSNARVKEGIADLTLLASYLEAMGVIDKVLVDLSLARGLDYYSGVIYEVVPIATSAEASLQVGSIAAGGRYDNLVGMYSRKQIPCVGISFGVDRIFTLLWQQEEAKRKSKPQKNRGAERNIDVYVMAFGAQGFTGLLFERIAMARRLWDAGIRAEYSAKVKPKPQQQFAASEDINSLVGVILGSDELAQGKVRVKKLNQGKGEEGGGRSEKTKDLGELVALENVVEVVKRILEDCRGQYEQVRT